MYLHQRTEEPKRFDHIANDRFQIGQSVLRHEIFLRQRDGNIVVLLGKHARIEGANHAARNHLFKQRFIIGGRLADDARIVDSGGFGIFELFVRNNHGDSLDKIVSVAAEVEENMLHNLFGRHMRKHPVELFRRRAKERRAGTEDFKQRFQNSVLAGEVVVKRAFPHAACFGNLRERYRVEPVRGKEFRGCAQDAVGGFQPFFSFARSRRFILVHCIYLKTHYKINKKYNQ